MQRLTKSQSLFYGETISQACQDLLDQAKASRPSSVIKTPKACKGSLEAKHVRIYSTKRRRVDSQTKNNLQLEHKKAIKNIFINLSITCKADNLHIQRSLQHKIHSRGRRVSKPSSLGWLVHLGCRGVSPVASGGGTSLTNISRDCTRRRVFLFNRNWLHLFGILFCCLLVHVLSNTSCKVIHL